jgi:hypothetical protein
VTSLVYPGERAAANGIHQVLRTGATALAPALGSAAMASPFTGAPFILAGALKIVYDLTLYFTFRHARPVDDQPAATTTVPVPREAPLG